jgi:hypothetical protein
LCITIGRIGGGADFEFDEPEASDVHCVIAARLAGVRLYVAPSVTNIYVNDQRIYTVELSGYVYVSGWIVSATGQRSFNQCAEIG